jgi:hypothetical protein
MAGTLRNPLFGGLEFTFGGDVGGAGATQGGTLPGFGNVPREILIQTAQELFNEGTKTREELSAVLGADVVNAALGSAAAPTTETGAAPAAAPAAPVPQGGYDPAAVPSNVRRQATQLNLLLTRQTSGMLGRGTTQTIERLQREIRTAINLPDAQIAIQAITLREAEGDIPAGGINPKDVPESVRGEVEKFNGLVRRRARVTDARSVTSLESQITRQRQVIQTAIAGVGK